MAAIARRDWPAIVTEVTKRLGGNDASGFSTRINYWIYHAYLHLATTYHHYELDFITQLVASTTGTNTSFSAVTPKPYILWAAVLFDPTFTTMLGPLAPMDAPSIRTSGRLKTADVPKYWSRISNEVHFDCIPAAAYKVNVNYYAFPAAPDLAAAATYPEFSEDCDEALIQAAVSLGKGSITMPGVERQLLSEWLDSQARPTILESPAQTKDQQRAGRSIGGAQG